MPSAALTPCANPRCPKTSRARYCDTCKPSHGRGTRQERGYGKEWQRLRKLVLSEQPICAEANCFAAATEVDHINRFTRGGPGHFDRDNLQGLCKPCHSRKTVREDGGLGRSKRYRGKHPQAAPPR